MQPASTSAHRPRLTATKPAIAKPAATDAVKHKKERRVHKEKRSHKTHSSSKPPDLVQKPAIINWKERGNFHLERKEWDLAIDAFSKILQEAEAKANPELIGECLKDLGRVYLEKEQWAFAAKIFNGAYALFQKSTNEKSKQATLAFMAEVERRILEKVCKVRKPIDPKVYLERRHKLEALRQESQVKIKNEIPTQVILLDFTEGISLFLEEVLKSGFDLFGKPPCDYTLIGLGSLARKEMSPFSDLEFALLIKKSAPENLEYFHKMVQWLELQVIHLGETAIKILDRGYESPVLRGFSFDDGGNTPLGKQGYVELIKTPEELAQFQSERFYDEDLILSNVLRGADVIVGSESLYKQYVKAVQPILNAKSAKPPLSIAQARALNLLKGHLVEFEPRIDKKKEETPIYNIKAELYRLPSFLIACLADYFGIGEQNTWKRLEALVKAKILSPEGAKHIQDAMAAIMRLRIRCHLFYGKECEDVYHPSMQLKIHGKKLQNVFVLTDADVNQIIEIYRVIFPLHRLFKQVYQSRDFAALAKESFYDTSPLAQGTAYEKLHQYAEAKKCYQQAVAVNPDDAEGLINLATLLWRLAEHGQAREYANKAHSLGKRKNDEMTIARALNLQGLNSNEVGESKNAIGYYEEALRIYQTIYGHDHHSVASCLNNLGIAWKDLGDAKKALRFYTEALRIGKKVYNVEHPAAMVIPLINYGHAWQALGDAKKAIGYYEEALRINKKVYGDEHLNGAINLSQLGSAWQVFGDPKKSVVHQEQALAIFKITFKSDHFRIALCILRLGVAKRDLKEVNKALDYFKQALEMFKKVHPAEHPNIPLAICELGLGFSDVGDTQKGLSLLQEAEQIHQKIYPDGHPELAKNCYYLGLVWKKLGETAKARQNMEKALTVYQKFYDVEHPQIRKVKADLSTLTEVNRSM